MQIIAADAEIEWTAEIGGQPEFLTQLPRMFFGQIFGDQPVAATQLRIAEDADCLARVRRRDVQGVLYWHQTPSRDLLCKRSGRERRVIFPMSGIDRECARPRVEPVVILGGPQEILIVAGLRGEGERRSNIVIGVQFQRVVFREIFRIDGRFDDPQIGRLPCAGIGIEGEIRSRDRHVDMRQAVRNRATSAVRHSEGAIVAVAGSPLS